MTKVKPAPKMIPATISRKVPGKSIASLLWENAQKEKSEDVYGDMVRTYLQEGRIYNRFVQLNGKSPTTQRLLVNSFLLEVVQDGQTMIGLSWHIARLTARFLASTVKLCAFLRHDRDSVAVQVDA